MRHTVCSLVTVVQTCALPLFCGRSGVLLEPFEILTDGGKRLSQSVQRRHTMLLLHQAQSLLDRHSPGWPSVPGFRKSLGEIVLAAGGFERRKEKAGLVDVFLAFRGAVRVRASSGGHDQLVDRIPLRRGHRNRHARTMEHHRTDGFVARSEEQTTEL